MKCISLILNLNRDYGDTNAFLWIHFEWNFYIFNNLLLKGEFRASIDSIEQFSLLVVKIEHLQKLKIQKKNLKKLSGYAPAYT